MTQQYDNTNRGAAWKNRDRKSDKHPHFRGDINVDGTEYWISVWYNKDSKENPKKPTFSFAVNLKEGQQSRSAPAQPDFDDDIPF